MFTDVDGTLVDHHTYSFAAASEILERLKRLGVPLVLCSSKTRAEIERVQQDLGTSHPFASENGGAVFVPAGYFRFPLPGAHRLGAYDVIELGTPYARVVELLRQSASASDVEIVGFSDMTVDELARDAGLSLPDARLAKLREYDEPFRITRADPPGPTRLVRELAKAGLRCSVGGRYHHASGATDKGMAVRLLTPFFKRTWGDIVTIGLGDGPNDVPMLRSVDRPVIVSNPASGTTPEVLSQVPGARVTIAPGPQGWREAITGLLG